MEFTKRQIKAYRKYESVRESGLYNMWDPRAQKASGLDRDAYLFCIKNYDELRKAAEAEGAGHGNQAT